MLGADHDGVNPDRTPAVVILDGNLGLAVGTQVLEVTVLADLRQLLRQAVCQVNGQRHQALGLVAGVTEHQPLVTGALQIELVDGALSVLVGLVDAPGDVGALAAQRDADATRSAVEPFARRVVANVEDGLASYAGNVGVGVGSDLSGNDDQAGRHQGLHGDAGRLARLQNGVQHSVADGISDLIWVTLGNRLGSE